MSLLRRPAASLHYTSIGTGTRRTAALTVAAVLLGAGGIAACGRSSSGGGSSTPTKNATAATSTPTATATEAAGSFGSLKNICGPGKATGATARGVTNTEIDLSTFSDTGNTIQPGLEQEFFDTGDAFVQWCNAAGGINGRKIVLHKRDAKLFNSASVVIAACQTDFMEVGGGTALDDATVKPRLACGLGDIPAYHVSPTAVTAGLQAAIGGAPSTQAYVGPYLALAAQTPSFKQHTGVWVNNLGSIAPQGKRTRAGLEKAGFTVKDFQEFPQTVANWRPYLSVSKNAGTELLGATGLPNYSPLFSGFTDVGFDLKAMVLTPDNYKSAVSDAWAAASNAPATYVYSNYIPFEMANSNPVAKEAVNLLTTTTTAKKLTGLSALSLSAWLLWADSATACGSNLTVRCVLDKAAQHPEWDAGGFGAPFNTDPAKLSYSQCFLMLKIDKSGFTYDKTVTNPNKGLFNCNADNIVNGLPTF
jgi:ABC-type branched-subunit amino acid transport system substrate-binding protein